jgi:NitT/TauT family transport system substrate-binding protein
VNGAMRINKDGALNMSSISDQLGWFKSEGLVKDTISMDMLVDSSYVSTI